MELHTYVKIHQNTTHTVMPFPKEILCDKTTLYPIFSHKVPLVHPYMSSSGQWKELPLLQVVLL